MGEGKGNRSSTRGIELKGGGRGMVLLSVVVAMVSVLKCGSQVRNRVIDLRKELTCIGQR